MATSLPSIAGAGAFACIHVSCKAYFPKQEKCTFRKKYKKKEKDIRAIEAKVSR